MHGLGQTSVGGHWSPINVPDFLLSSSFVDNLQGADVSWRMCFVWFPALELVHSASWWDRRAQVLVLPSRALPGDSQMSL